MVSWISCVPCLVLMIELKGNEVPLYPEQFAMRTGRVPRCSVHLVSKFVNVMARDIINTV